MVILTNPGLTVRRFDSSSELSCGGRLWAPAFLDNQKIAASPPPGVYQAKQLDGNRSINE